MVKAETLGVDSSFLVCWLQTHGVVKAEPLGVECSFFLTASLQTQGVQFRYGEG